MYAILFIHTNIQIVCKKDRSEVSLASNGMKTEPGHEVISEKSHFLALVYMNLLATS
jgi:hypothetical protein